MHDRMVVLSILTALPGERARQCASTHLIERGLCFIERPRGVREVNQFACPAEASKLALGNCET